MRARSGEHERFGELVRGVEPPGDDVEEELLSELDSRNAANLPVSCSSQLRTGESFRGDGGGLWVVAWMRGN